jgi:hypothetical protein
MADPLVIASGCTSLLEAISKLSNDIRAIVVALSGASKEIDALSQELNHPVPILSQIKDRSVIDSLSADLPKTIMRGISDILFACIQVVVELQVLLRKVSSSKMKKVKWSVSGKGEAARLRKSVQTYKVALEVALALNAL